MPPRQSYKRYSNTPTRPSRFGSPSSQSAQHTLNNEHEQQLYMGDLDLKWTEKDVMELLTNIGAAGITNIKLIKSSHNNPQYNNDGYCFLTFINEAAAVALMKQNGRLISPNKTLRLNKPSSSASASASSFSSSSSATASASLANTTYSVYVGDLSLSVTEYDLLQLFKSYYPTTVKKVKIVFDLQTSISKGYGFVEFSDSYDQTKALQTMNGVFLKGKPIRISSASSSSSSSTSSSNNAQANKSKSNQSRFGVGKTVKSSNSFKRTSVPATVHDYNQIMSSYHTQKVVLKQPTAADSQPFSDPNNTTVFVGGLYSGCTELELKSYFEPFGRIVYVKIPQHGKNGGHSSKNGNSNSKTLTTCGFVQFDNRFSAECAIARMQGYPIGNMKIRLSWGKAGIPPGATIVNFPSSMPLNNYKEQPETPTRFINPAASPVSPLSFSESQNNNTNVGKYSVDYVSYLENLVQQYKYTSQRQQLQLQEQQQLQQKIQQQQQQQNVLSSQLSNSAGFSSTQNTGSSTLVAPRVSNMAHTDGKSWPNMVDIMQYYGANTSNFNGETVRKPTSLFESLEMYEENTNNGYTFF
ncbi:hypothetical protein ACO0QE_000631 [Hanseniaspora vineae]